MKDVEVFSPKTLDEALDVIKTVEGRVIAGGTDVIPQMSDGRFVADSLIDISYLEDLRFIKKEGATIRIGALTTYSSIMQSDLLQTAAPLLVDAAATVGAVQTQNKGTLGGNIGNASPAGDLLPPLLSLNAEITLISQGNERQITLSDFLLGPGKTALSQGEIIHSISFKELSPQSRSTFIKLGNRRGMAISVVSTAVILRLTNKGKVEDLRISLGSVAPTPIRCTQAEAILLGFEPTPSLLEKAAATAADESAPISDIRASADYRRHAVQVLVQRALNNCLP